MDIDKMVNHKIAKLSGIIKPILGKDCPLTEDALFNKRPEQLSVQEFIDLTNRVEQALKSPIEATSQKEIPNGEAGLSD